MLYIKGDIVYVRATVTKDSTTPDEGIAVEIHNSHGFSTAALADYSFAKMETPIITIGMKVAHGPFVWEIIGRDGEELWLSRSYERGGEKVKEYASTTISQIHRRAS